eukprot:5351850-Pleurochrysis_carterae.AAC.3
MTLSLPGCVASSLHCDPIAAHAHARHEFSHARSHAGHAQYTQSDRDSSKDHSRRCGHAGSKKAALA